MLSDEIRINSDKLNQISHRIDRDKSSDGFDKEENFRLREKMIHEQENKIKSDMDFVETEKKRIERIRDELDNKELQLKQE